MSDERQTKQVIVIRKDLKMRRGKEIAQGAHASLGAVFEVQRRLERDGSHAWAKAYDAWFHGRFTKVCLQVETEEDLLDVYGRVRVAGLPAKLITDAGLTEFGGVPTKTCLAIGPAWADEIDKITGGLKLY